MSRYRKVVLPASARAAASAARMYDGEVGERRRGGVGERRQVGDPTRQVEQRAEHAEKTAYPTTIQASAETDGRWRGYRRRIDRELLAEVSG